MSELSKDIAAFEAMQSDLEADSLGKWAVVYQRKLMGKYETFDEAAESALTQFGRGPYLIRQIGAPQLVLPASVVYNLQHT